MFLLFGLPLVSPGQGTVRPDKPIKAKSYRAAIRQATRYLDSLRVQQHIPGLAITVVAGGTVVWQEGFGLADLENPAPVRSTSLFRVGSVSKSLTSVALAQLVEQGKLDLDAPIQRYVPSFPLKRYPVTLRQLAGHLAGIRHYQGSEGTMRKHYASVTQSLSIFQNDSLLFEPGTRYSYSSYGWNLLSAAIENASGQPFTTYMAQHVFAPLHLAHTRPDFSDSVLVGRTGYYQWSKRRQVVMVAPWEDVSYKWAGGGFLSSAADLATLGQALLSGQLLRAETTQLLFTSQHTRDGQETGYGLGWRTGQDGHGRRIVHHGGTAWGGRAFLLLYPDQHVVLAITTNLGNPDFAEVEMGKIAELFIRSRP
ncbi:serine hydrolase domain-containing protein [Hymenobacter daeguensis]